MVPVVQKQVTEINIVVRSGGAVDQYTAKQSVPRLHVEMRVVPGGSILGSTPLIGETVSGSDWTLSYTGNAIVVVGPVLSNAVEMNRSSVVLKCIGYMHDLAWLVHFVCAKGIRNLLTDPVAPVGDDGWTRKRTIDGHYRNFDPVWRGSAILDIEPVLSSDTSVGHRLVIIS